MKIPAYKIADTDEILSPGLVIFRDAVEANIDGMIAIAGNIQQLRPHCKTHKMSAVTKLQLDRGITKHKAATFAECEMLAIAGVKDIMLAYNLVGPNIRRAVEFRKTFPDVEFHVTADHENPIAELSTAMASADLEISVMLDIDCGLARTGIPAGNRAEELYRLLESSPGIVPGGFHVYDGHNHQATYEERAAAIDKEWNVVAKFRDSLIQAGLSVPRLVCGGTGSFPVYAAIAKDDPTIETSPGTCVFYDSGYGQHFADLSFACAAVMLTRVVSRPTENRLTLDLGTKAVASDPPKGKRVWFPELPDAKHVLQNEEHLVLEIPDATKFQPGHVLFGIPTHICPTSALHQSATVICDGKIVDHWTVDARDRQITI